MASNKITWDDKVGLTDYEVRVNQVQDRDMNEVKSVVNSHADNIKTVGTYSLIRFNSIYMGNLDTLNNGGVFKISSDNNITYKVIGWYCKIIKR